MPDPVDVVAWLRVATEAARAGDLRRLDEVGAWLVSVPPDELLRADRSARVGWEPPLGPSSWWETGAGAPVGAVALAALHRDGHLREAAVRELTARRGPLALRVLALRAGDHVGVVADLSQRALLARLDLPDVQQVAPVLLLVHGRARGSSGAEEYLAAAARLHGEATLWEMLRAVPFRGVRREAFRHSLSAGLLSAEDAVRMAGIEPDAVVLTGLVRHSAEVGGTDVLRSLLTSRSPLGRASALVRLSADQVDPDVLRDLLVDRSDLVRTWARRRAAEAGTDAGEVCAAVARSDARASLRERAYRALVEAGGEVTRREALALCGSGVPPLVRAGLWLLTDRAAPQDVGLLLDLLLTGTGRTARRSADVLLAHQGWWSVADLEGAWSSRSATRRRRAWQLQRRRGGWETAVADLRARAHHDLASEVLGTGLPPDGAPSRDQRARLLVALRHPAIDEATDREVAFAARLTSVPVGRPGAFRRAVRDLDACEPRRARERLRSLLVVRPDDLEARRSLAEAYRRDGQPTEAGRWGFLRAGAASDAECEAFVRHVRYPLDRHVTPQRMRRLLRAPHPSQLADDVGRARWDAATGKRQPTRPARQTDRMGDAGTAPTTKVFNRGVTRVFQWLMGLQMVVHGLGAADRWIDDGGVGPLTAAQLALVALCPVAIALAPTSIVHVGPTSIRFRDRRLRRVEIPYDAVREVRATDDRHGVELVLTDGTTRPLRMIRPLAGQEVRRMVIGPGSLPGFAD